MVSFHELYRGTTAPLPNDRWVSAVARSGAVSYQVHGPQAPPQGGAQALPGGGGRAAQQEVLLREKRLEELARPKDRSSRARNGERRALSRGLLLPTTVVEVPGEPPSASRRGGGPPAHANRPPRAGPPRSNQNLRRHYSTSTLANHHSTPQTVDHYRQNDRPPMSPLRPRSPSPGTGTVERVRRPTGSGVTQVTDASSGNRRSVPASPIKRAGGRPAHGGGVPARWRVRMGATSSSSTAHWNVSSRKNDASVLAGRDDDEDQRFAVGSPPRNPPVEEREPSPLRSRPDDYVDGPLRRRSASALEDPDLYNTAPFHGGPAHLNMADVPPFSPTVGAQRSSGAIGILGSPSSDVHRARAPRASVARRSPGLPRYEVGRAHSMTDLLQDSGFRRNGSGMIPSSRLHNGQSSAHNGRPSGTGPSGTAGPPAAKRAAAALPPRPCPLRVNANPAHLPPESIVEYAESPPTLSAARARRRARTEGRIDGVVDEDEELLPWSDLPSNREGEHRQEVVSSSCGEESMSGSDGRPTGASGKGTTRTVEHFQIYTPSPERKKSFPGTGRRGGGKGSSSSSRLFLCPPRGVSR